MSLEAGISRGHESLFGGFAEPDCGGSGSTSRESRRSGSAGWSQSQLGEKTVAPAARDRQCCPKPHGGGQRPKVEAKKGEVVRAYILEVKNDARLGEVQAYIARRWKLGVSQATVSRLLARLGVPRKKNFGGQ
jgi:hypothetical protein